MRNGIEESMASRAAVTIALLASCVLPLQALARPYIYSAQWENGDINVLDARTLQLREVFNAGETASWATLNRARTRLYVLNDVANKLVILDTRDGTIVNEVPIAGRPINVYVPDDDSRVYVGYWSGMAAQVDAIAVVDTSSATVVHVISDRADALAVSPDGTSVFVANGFTSVISAYDTGTYSIRATGSFSQYFPRSLRVSPDSSVVYMGGDLFIDTVNAFRADTMQPVFSVPTEYVYGQSMAISFDGRYVYSVGGNGGMAVIDTATARLVDLVSTCVGPEGVALSPDSRLVYVMCPFSYSIDVFDAYTRAPLGSVSNYFTPNSSMDFIGTPPGDILVSNSAGDSLSQILPQTNTAVDFGTIGTGQTDLVVSRDRRWLYVALRGPNRVAVISLAFSPPPPPTFISLDAAPDLMAISPDGKRLYVSQSGADKVSVVDLQSRTVVGAIDFETANAPRAVAVNANGQKLFVALSGGGSVDVFDTGTLNRIEQIVVGSYPSAIALSEDGAFGYVVSAYNHLSKIDAQTNSVLADWNDSLGSITAPPGPIGLSPDGRRAYVGLGDNADTASVEASISVINTSNGAILAGIPLPATPGDIAVDTEGRYVYVSEPTLNSVAVVDSAQDRVVAYISGLNAPLSIADPREPPVNILFRDGFD